MTDDSLDRARALVERAEELQRHRSGRETRYGVWEVDEATVDALDELVAAEPPETVQAFRQRIEAELGRDLAELIPGGNGGTGP